MWERGQAIAVAVKVYERFVNGGMQLSTNCSSRLALITRVVSMCQQGMSRGHCYCRKPTAADQVVVGMANGGSQVEVYSYSNASGTPVFFQQRSFTAFPGYTGGVTLAVADIDTQKNTPTDPMNHNYASIITGMAKSLPELAIWNAQAPQ